MYAPLIAGRCVSARVTRDLDVLLENEIGCSLEEDNCDCCAFPISGDIFLTGNEIFILIDVSTH